MGSEVALVRRAHTVERNHRKWRPTLRVAFETSGNWEMTSRGSCLWSPLVNSSEGGDKFRAPSIRAGPARRQPGIWLAGCVIWPASYFFFLEIDLVVVKTWCISHGNLDFWLLSKWGKILLELSVAECGCVPLLPLPHPPPTRRERSVLSILFQTRNASWFFYVTSLAAIKKKKNGVLCFCFKGFKILGFMNPGSKCSMSKWRLQLGLVHVSDVVFLFFFCQYGLSNFSAPGMGDISNEWDFAIIISCITMQFWESFLSAKNLRIWTCTWSLQKPQWGRLSYYHHFTDVTLEFSHLFKFTWL